MKTKTHKQQTLVVLNWYQQERDGNSNTDSNLRRETLETKGKEFSKTTLDFIEILKFSLYIHKVFSDQFICKVVEIIYICLRSIEWD